MAAEASPGAVGLRVADLDAERAFYERSIGLRTLDATDNAVRLGANGEALVELVAAPEAPPRPPRSTGLFHLAILVPSRAELARSLHRVIASGHRLTGASDHLVSEALYLNDAEGNGIEIYRDRPRDEWRYEDGLLQMATLPLDLEGVLGEMRGVEPDAGPMPEGTRMGHVHLQVADLDAARAFYEGALGLDVTVDSYPGALFLSSGGYHHHIGLNTWAGEGAPPPPPGSRGLRGFELALPGEEIEEIGRRLSEAGFAAERDGDRIRSADPSGNEIVIRRA